MYNRSPFLFPASPDQRPRTTETSLSGGIVILSVRGPDFTVTVRPAPVAAR